MAVGGRAGERRVIARHPSGAARSRPKLSVTGSPVAGQASAARARSRAGCRRRARASSARGWRRDSWLATTRRRRRRAARPRRPTADAPPAAGWPSAAAPNSAATKSGGSTLEEPTKSATKRGARPLVDLLAACRPASIRPSLNTATRSAIDSASPWSWVTKTKVMPSACCSAFSSSCICSRSLRSSAPSGSSSSSTFGLVDERAGERHALALAAGQLRRAGARRSPASRTSVERLLAPCVALGLADALRPSARRRRCRSTSDAGTAHSPGTRC